MSVPVAPMPGSAGAALADPVESRPALLTHRQILAIFAGLMIGMFLAALDQTIVATSIRTIADDLQGLSLQAWATTAYLITATITTPLYGKLSDLFGRKPLFLTASRSSCSGRSRARSPRRCTSSRRSGNPGRRAGGLFSRHDHHRRHRLAPERAKYQATSSRCSAREWLGPSRVFLAGRPRYSDHRVRWSS